MKFFRLHITRRQRMMSNRGDWLIERTFVVSEFKGHPRRLTLRIGGNRRFCPFSACCGGNLGEIADNAIDGSLLDILVLKWNKFVMN